MPHQVSSTFYRIRSSQFGSQWLKIKEEFMDQERVTSIENCAPRVGNQPLLLTLLERFAFIDRLVVLNGLLTWSRGPRKRFENVRRTLLICTFGFRSSKVTQVSDQISLSFHSKLAKWTKPCLLQHKRKSLRISPIIFRLQSSCFCFFWYSNLQQKRTTLSRLP